MNGQSVDEIKNMTFMRRFSWRDPPDEDDAEMSRTDDMQSVDVRFSDASESWTISGMQSHKSTYGDDDVISEYAVDEHF